MSDQANWMEINDKHLAATIAWIRLRLERLAQPSEHNAEPESGKKRGCGLNILNCLLKAQKIKTSL